MKQIDVAIAVSLDLMNYYAKLKNNLEDKIKYIQKIKNERNLAQDQVRENPKYQELENQSMEVWKFEKYLTNSKGERFEEYKKNNTETKEITQVQGEEMINNLAGEEIEKMSNIIYISCSIILIVMICFIIIKLIKKSKYKTNNQLLNIFLYVIICI